MYKRMEPGIYNGIISSRNVSRLFYTPKVPGSIPDLAVSMQFGFMLKMEFPSALTCP